MTSEERVTENETDQFKLIFIITRKHVGWPKMKPVLCSQRGTSVILCLNDARLVNYLRTAATYLYFEFMSKGGSLPFHP